MENNDFRENDALEEISEKSLPPEVPKTKKPRVSQNYDNDVRSDMDKDAFLSSLNEKIQSKNNSKGPDSSVKETSEVEEVDAVHFR